MFIRKSVVRAVESGGVIDETGTFLPCIGNHPLRNGDTIYTDGKVVYGHQPIKQVPSSTERLDGIPYTSFNSGYQCFVSKTEREQFVSPTRIAKGEWTYTTRDNYYCGNEDFIEMHVTPKGVYTAEFVDGGTDYKGKEPTGHGVGYDPHMFLLNDVKYRNYSPDPDTDEPRWTETYAAESKTYVCQNWHIVLKRDGVEYDRIKLSDYQFQVDKWKETYLEYDEIKWDGKVSRIDWEAFLGESKDDRTNLVKNVHIYAPYVFIQLLNIHFTDDEGNWEAILGCGGEAKLYPHVKEKSGTYSPFCLRYQVTYYTIRLTSINGNMRHEILQEFLRMIPYRDVLFGNKNFYPQTYRRANEVDPISVTNLATFELVLGNFTLETNILDIFKITDNVTNTIVTMDIVENSSFLIVSDWEHAKIWGSPDYLRYLRLPNRDFIVNCGFDMDGIGYRSGDLFYNFLLRHISAYRFENGDYLLGFHHGYATFCPGPNSPKGSLSTDELILDTAMQNMNFELLRDRKKAMKGKTFKDLISYAHSMPKR